ncbi:uncharacterized protein LOC109536130 isoform X1 [Dendroctonus ponderosae]|uniref:E3 ubiquitin-protein ligase E3D n=1 Tax=Dendroctonus ponderosae TaxID=77166 RepID=A0AAR5PAR6_DENPD|nr:uncharacterized protein LOC109536130 isoform X1 [Dendroctonus ponderosae]
MESKFHKSIVVELRPKLKSASVFITLKDDCPNATSVILVEHDFKVVFENAENFTVPLTNFDAQSSTLTSLKISEHFISFRLLAGQSNVSNFGSFKTELLENNDIDSKLSNSTFIKNNILYAIDCANCQRSLGPDIKFERVLPLPENLDQADWFCHGHDSNPVNLLEPKTKDFLFTNCYFCIHKDKISNCLSKNNVLVCKFCFNWLGTLSENCTVRLWFNTVTFRDNNCGVFNTAPLTDAFLTIRGLFECSLLNSIKAIFVYKNSDGAKHYLLLWVLEKQLNILLSLNEHSKSTNVAKTLFKFLDHDDNEILEQWKNDQSVDVVDVSKNMMVEVMKHLYNNNKLFPVEYSKSNNFLVSYLCMYD